VKIHLLTTQHRDSSAVQQWWQQQGWQVCTHDNTGRAPGAGRNEILEQFYSTSEPWLAMADDDMTIDLKRGWGQQFAQDPESLLNLIGDRVTSWGLMNNIHHRVDITLQNPAVQKNWVMYRSSWIGCLVFHRNTGQRFYNHPTDVLEDMDWCLDQIRHGHRVAHCMNLVQRCQGGAASTIFQNQAERRDRYLRAKQRIAAEYPGITLTESRRLVKTRFINQYWQPNPEWSSVPGIGPSLQITPAN